MKKMIISNLISNLIWVVTLTIGVVGAALFIDKRSK